VFAGLLIGWVAFFFKSARARRVAVVALCLPLLPGCAGVTSTSMVVGNIEAGRQATRAAQETAQALVTPHAEILEFQAGTPAPFSKTPAPNAASGELIFASPPDSLPPLTLNYQFEKHLYFAGTYLNPNDYPIEISAVITLFDSEGKFMGKESDFMGVLNPGQRKPFKVVFYEMQYKNLAQWANYKIEFSGQATSPGANCELFAPERVQITKDQLYNFSGDFRALQSLAYLTGIQVAFYNEDWDLLAYEYMIPPQGGIVKDRIYPLEVSSLHALADLRSAQYVEFVCTR
jgi:hypothetical protein